MGRKQKPPSINYLDLVPRRAIGDAREDDGRLVLLRPKYMSGLFARWLQPHLKHPHFRVKLDKFGAATWEAIDGARTVKDICDALYEKFGEEVEPRYERGSRFIHSLHQGAMIELQDPEQEARRGAV